MNEEDYLMHYGVLGMKWGVRRNPSRAYRRASKKANKFHATRDKLKANKKRFKEKEYELSRDLNAAKYERKVAEDKIKRGSLFAPSEYKFEKLESKERVAKANYNKAQADYDDLNLQILKNNKAYKEWISKMRDAFKDVKISQINEGDLSYGERYANMLIDDRPKKKKKSTKKIESK